MKLLLLPGFDGSGNLFSRLLAHLPTSITPIVVSYSNQGPQNYRHLCDVLSSQLPDSPYLILGESFGGPLSFLLAEQADDNLKGIILSASFIKNPRPKLTAWVRPVLRPRHFRQGLTPAWYIRQLLLNGIDDPCLVHDIQQATCSLPGNVYYERLQAIVTIDVSDQLRRFDRPVCYLRALHDRVVGAYAMNALLKVNQKVQIRNFSAPHMLLQTVSAQAAAAIHEFAVR